MAGAMRRMATYLGLVEDDQYYNDPNNRPADTSTDRVAVSETATTASTPAAPGAASAAAPAATERARVPQPTAAVHELAKPWERPGYEIPVVLPTTYNDARRIGEEFRSGSPVIMDLTSMSDADAKRIVDFAAGLVFGLQGMIERITAKIFLLSPDGVDVSSLAQAQVTAENYAR